MLSASDKRERRIGHRTTLLRQRHSGGKPFRLFHITYVDARKCVRGVIRRASCCDNTCKYVLHGVISNPNLVRFSPKCSHLLLHGCKTCLSRNPDDVFRVKRSRLGVFRWSTVPQLSTACNGAVANCFQFFQSYISHDKNLEVIK